MKGVYAEVQGDPNGSGGAAMRNRRSFLGAAAFGCLTLCLNLPVFGQAQLDSSCMVSALNRTAPVEARRRPDG